MVPLGAIVPEPVTVNATEAGVLSTMEVLDGDTVTVGVAFPAAPPPPPLPVLPLLPDEEEPQPIAANPTAATRTQAASILLHFRVYPGIKKITMARIAVPPAVLNHLDLPKGAGWRPPVEGAVVLTDTLAVPVVVVEPRETEEPAVEQVGRFVAPAGEDVSVQLSVTLPV
jgi:hypothetical protein